MSHQLPLPFAYDALESFIDAQTMESHHSRHPYPRPGRPGTCLYLNYQNKRGDYIDSFQKVVDWEAVEKNYQGKKTK